MARNRFRVDTEIPEWRPVIPGVECEDAYSRLIYCIASRCAEVVSYAKSNWDSASGRDGYIHRRIGEVILGQGESIDKGTYRFLATYGGPGSNYHRPLVSATASFNSDRWGFGGDNQVTYRLAMPGCRFTSGQLEFHVNYHTRGGCMATDGARAASGDDSDSISHCSLCADSSRKDQSR